VNDVVEQLRGTKSPAELSLIKQAVEITVLAQKEAISALTDGINEFELQALIEYTFRRNGASGPSYSSIVGSGPNATTLHYVENSRRVEEGDLVLVDAGAEYGYYAADITRTWPASGRFSPEQRAIYEIVLEAQNGAIEMSTPGVTMQDVHDFCVRTIAAGLVRLGLLDGPVEKAIEDGTYKKFYMHKTGHYLGMDVHDVGKYREGEEWRPLAPLRRNVYSISASSSYSYIPGRAAAIAARCAPAEISIARRMSARSASLLMSRIS
jgi:Xaa-Pro aminopeptidase